MHADSDVDRQAKLDQALLQERGGQVVPEFDPRVAVARTARLTDLPGDDGSC
jgi:hypothetical protein